MALPVTVYRWDDPGAPQLTQTHGSAVDVFKKCLIDGYGTKQPAGWVLEEISADNKNMIFSPAGRAWMYLIYDDGRNTFWGDSAATLGAIDAYNSIEEPISSLDYSSWIDRPVSHDSKFNQYIDKSSSKWVVLANSEFCYLLQENIGKSRVSAACFIGKLDSNGHNLSYTAIGHYGYYNDWDVGQLFSSHGSAECFLRRRTSLPILVDVNTGFTGSISTVGPTNPLNGNAKFNTPSAFSSTGVWGALLVNNSSSQLSALFPLVEAALSVPQSLPAMFEVIGDYLYFNRVRFYLGA